LQTISLLVWLFYHPHQKQWFKLLILALPLIFTIYIFMTPIYIGFLGLKINQAYFVVIFLNIFIMMLALPLNFILERLKWLIPSSAALLAVIMIVLAL
jgi:hypothetical protein